MIPLFLASMLLAAGDGKAWVTAYRDQGVMANGQRVHAGACAGPRAVPLGTAQLSASLTVLTRWRRYLRQGQDGQPIPHLL